MNKYAPKLPIIKIEGNEYLIGTKIVELSMSRGSCFVKDDILGFDRIEDYIESRLESDKS